jgi:type IV pilus assembly protein PilQ
MTAASEAVSRSLAGSGLVKRIQLASDDERLRLQVALKQAAIHALRAEEDRLLVELALQPAPDPAALQGISLQRGALGEARLSVELGSSEQTVQVRQLGGRLIADIAGATVPLSCGGRCKPASWARRSQYSALPHQEGARLVLEMQGQWRYHAYQSRRRLVIDVLPVSSGGGAGAGLQEGKTYGGHRLS